MPFAFRYQPLKGLYLVYQLITTLFVRLPYWILVNLPKSSRPRPTWTLKRCIMVNLTRRINDIGNDVGPFMTIADHRAIKSGNGVNGVWINGAPDLVAGELRTLAEVAKVIPIKLPGYWLHKKGTNTQVAAGPQPGEKTVLNLHGGAYVRLSAHPSDPTAIIVDGLLEHVKSVQRAFSVEYRLSSGKPFEVANPFPTALLDALSAYNYLVNVVGFPPSDIIVCGDSAGGNLAHALVRYLVENQGAANAKLPAPPGALVLLSPWSDLSQYHDDLPGGSGSEFGNTDYLSNRDRGIPYGKDSFTGPHGRAIADTSPYVSPASLHPGFVVSFKGFPRTFIAGGGAEVLIDQIRTLKTRMVKDLGEGNGVEADEGKVRFHEALDAVHDYIVFPWHEPERTDTLRAIAEWVDA